MLTPAAVGKLGKLGRGARRVLEGGTVHQVSNLLPVEVAPQFHRHRAGRREGGAGGLVFRRFQPSLVEIDAGVGRGEREALVLPGAVPAHRAALQLLLVVGHHQIPVHLIGAGDPVTHRHGDILPEEDLAAAGDFGHHGIGRNARVAHQNAGDGGATGAERADDRRRVHPGSLTAIGKKHDAAHVIARPIPRQFRQAGLEIGGAVRQPRGRPLQIERDDGGIHRKNTEAGLVRQQRNDLLAGELDRPIIAGQTGQLSQGNLDRRTFGRALHQRRIGDGLLSHIGLKRANRRRQQPQANRLCQLRAGCHHLILHRHGSRLIHDHRHTGEHPLRSGACQGRLQEQEDQQREGGTAQPKRLPTGLRAYRRQFPAMQPHQEANREGGQRQHQPPRRTSALELPAGQQQHPQLFWVRGATESFLPASAGRGSAFSHPGPRQRCWVLIIGQQDGREERPVSISPWAVLKTKELIRIESAQRMVRLPARPEL